MSKQLVCPECGSIDFVIESHCYVPCVVDESGNTEQTGSEYFEFYPNPENGYECSDCGWFGYQGEMISELEWERKEKAESIIGE